MLTRKQKKGVTILCICLFLGGSAHMILFEKREKVAHHEQLQLPRLQKEDVSDNMCGWIDCTRINRLLENDHFLNADCRVYRKVVVHPEFIKLISNGYNEDNILEACILRDCAVTDGKDDAQTIYSFTGAWCPVAAKRYRFDQNLADYIIEIISNTPNENGERGPSVLEFGAGIGRYVQYYVQHGIDAKGYDGLAGVKDLSKGLIDHLDLTLPIPNDILPADIVICFEVGEHILPVYSDILMDNLANKAKRMVIMSWGRPGQGGYGHLNNLPQDDVINRMESRGLVYNRRMSLTMREFATQPYFKKNCLVFEKKQLK